MFSLTPSKALSGKRATPSSFPPAEYAAASKLEEVQNFEDVFFDGWWLNLMRGVPGQENRPHFKGFGQLLLARLVVG
jgi:hypothetical protein